MIFGNKTSNDILLKQEIENLSNSQTLKFKPFFTIDTAEENWTGGVGFITKEMIKENLPGPSDDTLILMCGPPVMCDKVLKPFLKEMGYSNEDIFEF
jgi:cytochrome-b5 reductase